MMKLTPFLIERFARWIAGGVAYSAMKSIVLSLDDADMTGAQKREHALRVFANIGYSLAGWLVNLLLELVVAWVRSKAQSA
jgi:hypothetical protein